MWLCFHCGRSRGHTENLLSGSASYYSSQAERPRGRSHVVEGWSTRILTFRKCSVKLRRTSWWWPRIVVSCCDELLDDDHELSTPFVNERLAFSRPQKLFRRCLWFIHTDLWMNLVKLILLSPQQTLQPALYHVSMWSYNFADNIMNFGIQCPWLIWLSILRWYCCDFIRILTYYIFWNFPYKKHGGVVLFLFVTVYTTSCLLITIYTRYARSHLASPSILDSYIWHSMHAMYMTSSYTEVFTICFSPI
jgi:hypothetical protein